LEQILFPRFIQSSGVISHKHDVIWGIWFYFQSEPGFFGSAIPFPVIAWQAGGYKVFPAIVSPSRSGKYMVNC
jgi:hypothetical protein